MNIKVLHGILDTVILDLIEKSGSMHGYGIIVLIRRQYKIYLGPSTIYPALTKLESEGKITSEWNIKGKDRPIKLYTLTAKGKTEMNLSRIELKTLVLPLCEA